MGSEKGNYSVSSCGKAVEEYKQIFGNDVFRDKMGKNDCIALPDINTAAGLAYADDSIDFIKYCQQNDALHQYALITDGDNLLNSLHSVDIVIPLLIIAENGMLPIALNLISSFVYNKISSRKHEPHNLKVNIILENGECSKKIEFDGNADDFSSVIKEINKLKL